MHLNFSNGQSPQSVGTRSILHRWGRIFWRTQRSENLLPWFRAARNLLQSGIQHVVWTEYICAMSIARLLRLAITRISIQYHLGCPLNLLKTLLYSNGCSCLISISTLHLPSISISMTLRLLSLLPTPVHPSPDESPRRLLYPLLLVFCNSSTQSMNLPYPLRSTRLLIGWNSYMNCWWERVHHKGLKYWKLAPSRNEGGE